MSDFKAIERNKDIGSSHSLLVKGLVPGIIYGKGTEPTKIALEDKLLKKLMGTGSFYSTIINLDVEGKKEKILPNPITHINIPRIKTIFFLDNFFCSSIQAVKGSNKDIAELNAAIEISAKKIIENIFPKGKE